MAQKWAKGWCNERKKEEEEEEEEEEGKWWSSNDDNDLKVIVVAVGANGNTWKSITTVLILSDLSPIHSAEQLQKLIGLETTTSLGGTVM